MLSARSRQFLSLGALVLGGVLAAGGPSRAGLMVTLSDGNGHTVTLTDTGNTGLIMINNTVGNFTVSGSVDGPPNPADVTPGELSQTQATTNVSSTGSGTLTITVVDTGLQFNPVNNAAYLESVIGASAFRSGGSSATNYSFQSYLDSANNTSPTPGTTYTTGLQGPYTGTSPSPNADATVLLPTGISGPFSLINVLTFNAGAAGALLKDTGTTNVYSTPEPATLAGAVVGVALFGIAGRRRRSARR